MDLAMMGLKRSMALREERKSEMKDDHPEKDDENGYDTSSRRADLVF